MAVPQNKTADLPRQARSASRGRAATANGATLTTARRRDAATNARAGGGCMAFTMAIDLTGVIDLNTIVADIEKY